MGAVSRSQTQFQPKITSECDKIYRWIKKHFINRYLLSFQMLFHWIKDEKYLPLLKNVFLFTYLSIRLFTFQAQQFPYILLQKALNCTLFSCIWIAFWPKTPYGGAYSTSPYSLVVGTAHLLFVDHFWKDNLNPDNIFYDIA